MADFEAMSRNLQDGKAEEVESLVQKALDEGIAAKRILDEGLMPGMSVIGEKFKNNEVFVPEVLIAARAMNAGTALLRPYFMGEGVEPVGRAVIGTVKGDLHDIGKNLVKMMMEGKGIEMIDLGTDVAPQTFIEEAKAQGAQIICCSALLTTTMSGMEEIIAAAESEGLRDAVTIMVGGAPVTDSFREKIGADIYSPDAASAADAAMEAL
jgi:corrinoid protein of di/trimethylamine methyltransferase